MLMLAFHIVAVGLLAAGVGYAAYQAGYRKAERRMARRLQAQGIRLQEDSA
jgi:biopolymer transport protein ExbB/TolQ